MSAIALNLYQRLRKGGMDDRSAGEIAENIDEQFDQVLHESKEHSKELVAQFAKEVDIRFRELEARFEARFVTKEEFAAFRAETRTEFNYMRWGGGLILALLLTDLVRSFFS